MLEDPAKREIRLARRAARRPLDPVRQSELLSKLTAITELFELILLQVDLRTLLMSAQRVSRAWHNLVSTSTALQRALFLAPSKPGRPAHELAHRPHPYGSRKRAVRRLERGTLRNPYCDRLLPRWGGLVDGAGSWDSCSLRLDMFVDPEQSILGKPATAFMYPGASWRRMLVQQNPPVRIVGMLCSEGDREQRSLTLTTKLYDVAALTTADGDDGGQGGFTIGQAFDMCRHLSTIRSTYNVSVRGKWRFWQVLRWHHTYWPYSADGDGGYDSEYDSEDDSSGGLCSRAVPEFEELKRQLVDQADIVFQVSHIAYAGKPGYDICLFGSSKDMAAGREAFGPAETEQGLLRMRKHSQISPPLSP